MQSLSENNFVFHLIVFAVRIHGDPSHNVHCKNSHEIETKNSL